MTIKEPLGNGGKLDKTPNHQFLKFYFFCAAVYLVQATGTMGGIAGTAITFFMKEGLGLTATTMAYIAAVTSVAWWIKPGFGLLSDFVPIGGYRRKSYIYICNTVSILLWLSLAALSYKGLMTTYWPIAIVSCVMAFCFAMTDVVADGLMVQTGKAAAEGKSKEEEKTGDFQSVQWITIRLGTMATVLLGTLLANWAMPDNGTSSFEVTQQVFNRMAVIFLVASFFPLINILATYFLTEEEKIVLNRENFRRIKEGIKKALKMKRLWILALCIFGLHFSPGWGQPFFYYMRDHCGPDGGQLAKMDMAWLSTFESAMGAIGVFAYSMRWRKKINLNTLLYISVLLGFFSSFCYLWVKDIYSLYLLAAIFGPIGGFIFLAYLNIAAKNCPDLAEGFVFAGLMSVFNIASSASSALGGWFYDKLEMGGDWYAWGWKMTSWLTDYGVSPHMVGLRPLIIISAFFTLLTLFLIPLMKLDRHGFMKQD